jgi:hypothetical protein
VYGVSLFEITGTVRTAAGMVNLFGTARLEMFKS